MNLTLRYYPDPILRKKCAEIPEVTKETQELLREMAKLMYKHKGVGLAAPQVGFAQRAIVLDAGQGLVCLVNPKIISKTGKEMAEEGCLCLPGLHLEVKRAKEVTVQGWGARGELQQVAGQGLLARALQHEIDHLEGILFIDRVPEKRLKTVRDQLEEFKKN